MEVTQMNVKNQMLSWLEHIFDSNEFPSFTIKNETTGLKYVLENNDKKLIIGYYDKPKIATVGLFNICYEKDDEMNTRFSYVPFLDYDFVNEKLVEEELEWLVEKYKLTNFYLFFTSRNKDEKANNQMEEYYGNYSAISLTKLPFKTIIDILKETTCDANYLGVPSFSRYKSWVLRFIGKNLPYAPQFLRLVPKEPVNMERRISKAHKEFIEKWYNVPKLPYQNIDNSSFVLVSPYLTNKKQEGG